MCLELIGFIFKKTFHIAVKYKKNLKKISMSRKAKIGTPTQTGI